MKKILIITISLLIVGLLYSYYKADISIYFLSKHIILWNENIEIKPSDFQAEIDPNSDPSTKIYWYHGFYLTHNNIEDAEVKSFFDKDKSWIRDTTNFKQEMKLQKLRFDLYESYARKYNRNISEIKFDNKTSFEDLEKVGYKINTDLQKTQDSIYADLRNAASKNQNNLPDINVINYWNNKIGERIKYYAQQGL